MKYSAILRYVLITILFAFGLLTLFLSASVLADLFGIRQQEGNYVPLVVWSNLVASILYLAASVALTRKNKLAPYYLVSAVLVLVFASVGFYAHISAGGVYETSTIGALAFRLALTILLTIASFYVVGKGLRGTLTVAVLLVAQTVGATSQIAPFQIALKPINIDGLTAVQSFAVGKHNDMWLIIGGRLDGLHPRQPNTSFSAADRNGQIQVVDRSNSKVFNASLQSLSARLREQLSSTNMEFYQVGDFLYVIGGYGYSETDADHITFPYLTVIDVPRVVAAVIAGTPMQQYFTQVHDETFAVTGGYLNEIDDTLYLTGGQKFTGRYNPMGHATYTQKYTDSYFKFSVIVEGGKVVVQHHSTTTDTALLHRRDYNVVPQIMEDGSNGLTAFSGVFQRQVDIPFLNAVNITAKGHAEINDFSQYYNHYHCAHLPLYSSGANEMHTVFFGGIAQYYDSVGILVQDNRVPFVKTIARVTRDRNGQMAEYKLPIEMPSLIGAGSEFISLTTTPSFSNGVIRLDDLPADTTLVGHIYGGILSSQPNVFTSNNAALSEAAAQVFEVYVVKSPQVGVHSLNRNSINNLHLQIYPNPNNGDATIAFTSSDAANVTLTVHNSLGMNLEQLELTDVVVGRNVYFISLSSMNVPGAYFIKLTSGLNTATHKIIVAP